MTITVRPATGEDIPWMLDQLKAFDDFNDFPVQLFPEELKAIQVLDEIIAKHPVFVAEQDAELLGFIAGVLTPHFFNQDVMVMTELLWWVQPEHRGTRAGLLLLNAFEDCGEREADVLIMTLEHKSPVNPKTLTRRGYLPCEHSYAKLARVA